MPRKKKTSKRNLFEPFVAFLRILGVGVLRLLPFAVLSVAICLFVVGMRNYLYADTHLLITNLRLITDGDFPREAILERVPVNSGQSIFSVDVQKVARSLSRDPRIGHVIVKKEFPNTLLVHLKVRKPFCLLQTAPGEIFYVMDPDGYVIETRHNPLPGDPVLVTEASAPGKKLRPGDQYLTPNVENAFYVLRYLTDSKWFSREQVKELRIDRLGSVSFITELFEIRLGGDRLNQGLQKVPQALKILKEEQIDPSAVRYIDLRFEDIIIKKVSA